jgi:hypothetical protein
MHGAEEEAVAELQELMAAGNVNWQSGQVEVDPCADADLVVIISSPTRRMWCLDDMPCTASNLPTYRNR